MTIRSYLPKDKDTVIKLWRKCELIQDCHIPEQDIERKLKVNPELFLVGLVDDKVVATVMGGYEGHRGWVNYLAVEPSLQRRGLGRQIMETVENKLYEIGCPKINLQIRVGNQEVVLFYQNISYEVEERVSMAKRLMNENSDRG